MRCLPLRHRVRVPALLTALVLAGTGVVGVAATPPAAADPALHGARAQAAAIQAEVERLQTEVEVAVEHYNATEEQLGQVVTQHLLAQRQLQEAQAAAENGGSALDRRVRALYMSGGPLQLMATVLDAENINDALARVRAVRSVVSADRDALDEANGKVEDAAAAERRLAELAATRTHLQQAAAGGAEHVRDLLARRQAVLAGANAQVARLVAQQQAAAAQVSAAQFAARLAAARGATGIDPSLLGSQQPPNATAAAAIQAAHSRLGLPYVWGAIGPGSFDCSGLTQWAYAQAGIALPRVAADQWNAGPHPALAQLAPGDLLFWATDPDDPRTIHHVAIYLGAGQMLAAPHTGDVVKIQPVYLTGFVGATRPTAQ